MRELARRPPLAVFTTLVAALFGGAGAGLGLAAILAPGSAAGSTVSFLLFPTGLFIGYNAWLGLAVLLLLPRFLSRLVSGAPLRRAPAADDTLIPPGAWSFLPVCSVLGLGGGITIALLSGGTPWIIVPAYWAAGSLYGAALFGLARSGYLPFPQSA